MRLLLPSLLLLLSACGTTPSPAPADSLVPAATGEPASSAPAGQEPVMRFLDAAGHVQTEVYYSDPTALMIDGLSPGEAVTVTADMDMWQSKATFVADAEGRVDTRRDAPLSGSYAGVDGEGLFWSMDAKRFALASSADVTFTLLRANGAALQATLYRSFRLQAQEWVVDAPGVVGRFFVPAGPGPFPAVLTFGGSEGGLSGGISYAEELVRDGYAVLAIAYFGAPGVPQELSSIPLEYFDKAIDWLLARKEVAPGRLGVMGGSRGGELALLLASRRSEVRATVADVPSPLVWSAVAGDGPAWTERGAGLPFVPSARTRGVHVDNPRGSRAWAFTPAFEASLAQAPPAALEAARIPIDRASGAIAMFAGQDDQLWPSCKFVELAMQWLRQSGHAAAHADEGTCFEGAGHLVTTVGLPTTWNAFVEQPGLGWMALGGTAQGSAHAGRKRQERVRAFLEAQLKRAPF